MKFRYARHSDNLDLIGKFYTDVIGLEKLGDFQGHANYNGIFLGKPNLDWHLEFTESNEKANHHADKDDLMVFYLDSLEELEIIINKAKEFGIAPIESKNPYWNTCGKELRDPDNYGLILTVKEN